ncbi:MAG: hypothetical protein ABI867_44830 [Kofleriaceae bacterium]
MSNLTEIDRLIEEGLALYGQGDLDGALLSWEQVLAVDPENAQANSYVDYVRQNYELLTNEVTAEYASGANSAPFGIGDDEEPEYYIEIVPGELEPATVPPMQIDPLDEGWFMDDESGPRRSRTISRNEPLELTLEADEPPLPAKPIIQIAPEEPPPISFDDQTREYPGGPPARRQAIDLAAYDAAPDPVTSEFHPEGTPGFGTAQDYHTPPGGFQGITPGFDSLSSEFRTQVTDVKKRDTGFVQPAAGEPGRSKRASSQMLPPELKMTLRTPGEATKPPRLAPALVVDDDEDPFPELSLTPPPATSAIELSYDDPPAARPHDDLINSLPSPTPSPLKRSRPNTDVGAAVPPVETERPSTKDFPPANRPPAQPSTRDFPPQKTDKLPTGVRFNVSDQTPPAPGSANTRDQTGRLPNLAKDILIGAPTRDLGLRAAAEAKLGDEEPTAARVPRNLDGGTRADVILAFDPIDARSAHILDEVDVGAPDREAKEDRTRRRISTLFERAMDWNRAGEFDRAVAAVDLALSEDPNSALAQKLIHRNRETMMSVFQAFLGDLQRQPTLARPLHELANAPISPRAAFLLSRVDGTLSLDEILDVSGMPRLEAYRYLCQLFLRGILR